MVKKYEKLMEYLSSLGSVAVAFSGGVDSAFLLKTAHDVLGDNAIAITEVTAVLPGREREDAETFCADNGIKQVTVTTDVLKIEGFAKNPYDRCYICKKELFSEIKSTAAHLGIRYVCEGSNTDDDTDYRPGMRAVAELDIKSPLKYAGLSKAEIRALSKDMGLSTWDKPSFACLASRFVYGERITEEKLGMVEKAEQLLFNLGISQFRVRIHDRMARIEVEPKEFGRVIAASDEINTYFKSLGFSYAALDLGGYRTGSMNGDING